MVTLNILAVTSVTCLVSLSSSRVACFTVVLEVDSHSARCISRVSVSLSSPRERCLLFSCIGNIGVELKKKCSVWCVVRGAWCVWCGVVCVVCSAWCGVWLVRGVLGVVCVLCGVWFVVCGAWCSVWLVRGAWCVVCGVWCVWCGVCVVWCGVCLVWFVVCGGSWVVCSGWWIVGGDWWIVVVRVSRNLRNITVF